MDDWKKLLGSVAPVIGSVLGGPIGGVAASFVADKLGLSDKSISAVEAALTDGKLTPEQLSQLKLADIEFQKFCKQNEIDLEKIYAEDRNSARQMMMATKSYVPATLTFLITAGYFITLIGMMTKQFQVADSQVMLMMLGQLGTAWGVAIAYWFGTTKNSQEKTNLLANSAPAK